MGHASWGDIFFFAVFGGLSVGVYYLFYYFGAPQIVGEIFAGLSFCSFCFLRMYIPHQIRKNKAARRQQKNLALKQEQQDIVNANPEKYKLCNHCGSKVLRQNRYCYTCGNQIRI